MFKRTIITFALGVVSLAAQSSDWSTVAAACVPDEESIGRYAAELGSFEFRGANVGQVDARCSITNPRDNGFNPGWGLMEVTLNDPDGGGAGSQIVVYLRRVNKFTGASADIHVFNSNLFAAGQALRTTGFGHVFDFANYSYYIAFSVRRNGTTLAPRIQRVRLLIPAVG